MAVLITTNDGCSHNNQYLLQSTGSTDITHERYGREAKCCALSNITVGM